LVGYIYIQKPRQLFAERWYSSSLRSEVYALDLTYNLPSLCKETTLDWEYSFEKLVLLQYNLAFQV